MKIAAAEALAALAKEPVPAEVCSAYNVDSLEYGFDYIIPKPLDPAHFDVHHARRRQGGDGYGGCSQAY